MLERTTFQTVTSLQTLSPGSISHPFSNDGECPEELHVLNWSQVRSLPAAAVAQSVEQLKRFSITLSPSPLSNHHPQILANAGADYIRYPAGSNPALQQCSEVSPSLVATFFQKPITSNGDECRWNYMASNPPVVGSNPTGPTFPFYRDRSSVWQSRVTLHQSLSSPPFLTQPALMLPLKQLEHAIEIQGRAFKLLQWLAKAIREGFVPLTKAHDVADAAHAAKAWIEGHYHNLPFDCRHEQSELEEFANFFGSYLDTSFDIVEAPAERYVSECGCYCPMCRRLANPQHLKAKSLTKVDKNRAAKLRVRRIEMLALEEGLPFNELLVHESLQDAEFRHSASLAAYGSELLERLNGFSDGPAVLALWRDFAWTAAGAPNRQFKLKAELIHQAEQKLTHIVREHSLA